MLGYNIYKDNSIHNPSLVVSNSYTVDGLTNGTEYLLGVAAVYFASDTENSESDPITVLSTPNFIYGDISGIVSDINGSPISGAIVSASCLSDTTDNDGVSIFTENEIGYLDDNTNTLIPKLGDLSHIHI